MQHTSALISTFFLAVHSQDEPDYPDGFLDLCKDKNNIIKWENVPHDWAYDVIGDDKTGCCDDYVDQNEIFPTIPNCCEGNGNGKYLQEDWWSWDQDWKEKIASGDLKSYSETEKYNDNGACNKPNHLIGSLIEYCDPSDDATGPNDGKNCENKSVEEKCRRACGFSFTTTTGYSGDRCEYFSFDEDARTCLLFSQCSFGNFVDSMNIGGQVVDTSNMVTMRVRNIYPVGFRPFDLREFNEPPICIWVPNSGDKKVEVMIETEMNGASVCIRDGSDLGMGRNSDVGNVETCNEGRLEACFTAATRKDQDKSTQKDFFFMIYCEGSCEASDVDLWLRIRTSRIDWKAGKTDTEDDIEMWCEMEKGSTSEYLEEPKIRDDYSWPSQLLPNSPEYDPFDIKKNDLYPSFGIRSTLSVCTALSVVLMMLL